MQILGNFLDCIVLRSQAPTFVSHHSSLLSYICFDIDGTMPLVALIMDLVKLAASVQSVLGV